MKEVTKKQRAPRNRTLTLSDEDILRLKKRLIKGNQKLFSKNQARGQLVFSRGRRLGRRFIKERNL